METVPTSLSTSSSIFSALRSGTDGPWNLSPLCPVKLPVAESFHTLFPVKLPGAWPCSQFLSSPSWLNAASPSPVVLTQISHPIHSTKLQEAWAPSSQQTLLPGHRIVPTPAHPLAWAQHPSCGSSPHHRLSDSRPSALPTPNPATRAPAACKSRALPSPVPDLGKRIPTPLSHPYRLSCHPSSFPFLTSSLPLLPLICFPC